MQLGLSGFISKDKVNATLSAGLTFYEECKYHEEAIFYFLN